MAQGDSRGILNSFSLVELLVTISIIALLSALVYPAFMKVLVQARTAKCLGNHRAITAAYLAYLADNNNMLWYRPADSTWSGGSGGIFGPQTVGSVGYFCGMLAPYGLTLAKWNSWKDIHGRSATVWYCPASYGQKAIAGHGATYFYQYPGTAIGASQPVSLAAVSSTIGTNWYLRDYFGNHANPGQLYGSSATNIAPITYSYLDGHAEYR